MVYLSKTKAFSLSLEGIDFFLGFVFSPNKDKKRPQHKLYLSLASSENWTRTSELWVMSCVLVFFLTQTQGLPAII